MDIRLNAFQADAEAIKLMMAIEAYIARCSLPATLIHLVKLRASQLNGCAYCIEMHTREATKDHLAPGKLLLLSAWQESSAFTARERAALAWTEALTDISRSRAPDSAWQAVRGALSDQEIMELTMVINQINAWNRIAVGFRIPHPHLASAA